MDISSVNSNKIRNMGIICAFLVVAIHCRPHFSPGTFAWYVKELLENGIAEIAVPFFFVVSGVMLGRKLMHSAGGRFTTYWTREVYKRVFTLAVPFLIWNALYWLVTVLCPLTYACLLEKHPTFPPLPSFQQFGLWFTGNTLLSPLWYIRALFVMVVLSPALICGLRMTGGWLLLLLFAFYGILCPGSSPMFPQNSLQHFFRTGIFPLRGVFYFTLGLGISQGMVTAQNVPLSPWLSIGIGLGLFLIRSALQDAFGYLRSPVYWHLGYFALPFVLYGTWCLVPSCEWPAWLTKNAFPVFLMHKFVLWYFAYKGIPLNHGVISYLAGAIAVFACSLLAANTIRRFSPKCAAVLFGGR